MVTRLAPPSAPSAPVDMAVRVRGVVQGVGFRPFVHREATRLGLRGWVRNDAEGVLIRAAGPPASVSALVRALKTCAPPSSRAAEVESRPATPVDAEPADSFVIAASGSAGLRVATAIPPDFSLCSDCRRELHDPRDRRYRYPFINCTQCGPRYSIVE